MNNIILCHLKTFLVYLSTITIVPLIWLPVFLYKIFVVSLVYCLKPNYGKTINSVDVVLEEESLNRKDNVPKCSLVNSVTLEGSITIEELRDLFRTKVLQKALTSRNRRKSSSSSNNNNNTDRKDFDENFVARYPELKQYPTSFLGYTFWKTDDKFLLEDHIIEECYGKEEQPNLSLIHQDMINRSFVPQRSPWEMVLINNYQSFDSDDENANNGTNNNRALIITRFHHCIADARSILKLFVECLGEQTLITAEQQPSKSVGVKDVLMVPVNFICIIADSVVNAARFWVHPWKIVKSQRKESDAAPQIVRVSQKLSLKDVKEIGKKSEGSAATVIIAIISGAITRMKPDIGNLFTIYILPKDNHPETLGNHASFGALTIPSGEESPLQRLHKSRDVFQKLKSSNMGKYMDVPLYVLATLFNPLRRIFFREIMSSSPIGITNIAGERDGFSIGQRKCKEFIFSVGTLLGDIGVVFCVSSYRDHLRIVVISAGGILSEGEVEELADNMGKELQLLKELVLVISSSQF